MDVLAEALNYGAVLAALAVGALVAYWVRGAWLPLRIRAAVCLAAAAFLATWNLSWAIGFRDGMGPDGTVHSEGLTAVRKSLAELATTSVTLVLITAGLATFGLTVALLSRRRRCLEE